MDDLHEKFSVSSFSSSPSNFFSSNVQASSKWCPTAEEWTKEILCSVQPSLASEQFRNGVIEYIQSLIRYHFGTEVFPFGSVPLKTYIPDGDIDLTAFIHPNEDENLARHICSMLECEGQKGTEFQIKNIRLIHARVKIVKCIVHNIKMDISFNQSAGLSTMCFLEQVDQLIGKDHLFKRSVILIKAWCYYESRILGAHHGLFSTYALETLVLYIINLFHSSLVGPLTVLYKFLAYYSTFEWDKYCVSLNGLVPISSLPEILVETLENDGGELLLKDFLRSYRENTVDPTRVETRHEFPIKHINIVDPLKDGNNLGCNISKGNFSRIKSALAYGSQQFEEIPMLPGETMGEELKKFFMITLERNGRGQRPDVQVRIPVFGSGRLADLGGDCDRFLTGIQYAKWYTGYTIPFPIQPSPPSSLSPFQNNSWGTNVLYLGQSSGYPDTQLPVLGYGVEQILSAGTSRYNQSRGTGLYIPDTSLVEKAKFQGTGGTYIRYMGTEERVEPQGSASYFTSMVHHTCGEMHSSARGENLESSSHDVSSETDQSGKNSYLSLEEYPHLPCMQQPLPSKRGENLESSSHDVSSETDQSGKNSYLSLEEYPHLPCMLPLPSKRGENLESSSHDVSSETDQSGKNSYLSLEEYPHLPCMQQPLPSKIHENTAMLHSVEESKQPGCGALSSVDAMVDVPATAMQKTKEVFDSTLEMYVHPYELNNFQDFPPLRMDASEKKLLKVIDKTSTQVQDSLRLH